MDGRRNAEDAPARTRVGRAVTLGTQLRWADAAMARQRDHVAVARDAIAELRALREEALREETLRSDDSSAHTGDFEAELLTRRIEVLERQLETLEHAGATAQAQALGLRDVSDRAGDGLPFQAGPVSGIPDLDDFPAPG